MPKRKENNRNSYSHLHIIGSYYSQRMKRVVEYKSLGERLFYYYLELDRAVIRYYVQPVEVPMPKQNDLEDPWVHIPNVLVFRSGNAPFLYQIKDSVEEEFNNKQKLINERCEAFVIQHGWNYQVITPKSMPTVLSRNIRFLKNFLERT